MARRGDDERRPEAADSVEPDAGPPDGEDERHRRAARAYFRAAPPYRIQPEEDGRFSLRRKRYLFRETGDPALCTTWSALSHHADLEEAERRLRRITAPVAYYDERGRLAQAPREPERDWGVPDDD